MESTTRTDESSTHTDHPEAARETAPANAATTEVHRPPTPATPVAAAIGDQCAACGAALAADQRYCLECGQRRREVPVPFTDGLPQLVHEAPLASPPVVIHLTSSNR